MSTCTKCHEEKPAEEFYLFTKSGTERRKQCKVCSNSKRTSYKGYKSKHKRTGFAGLPANTQVIIIEQLASGMSAKKIALAHGIKYQTFMRWKRKGQIKKNVASL